MNKELYINIEILKRVLPIILVIFLLLLSIVYLAFFYKAPENREFSSVYLEDQDDKYVELNNFKVHYLEKGQGDPIILIHGGGSWLYSYRNNIEELSNRYKVYAIDMPGHGYTKTKVKCSYDLDTYADFVKDFMESQHIEKAKIVGHSWGGGWSIYFTEKYPEKVDKLVLLDSSGLNEKDKSEWKYFGYPIIGEIVSKFITKSNSRSSLEKMVIDQNILSDNYIEEIYTPLSYEENRNAQVQAERHLDWKITEEGMNNINQKVLLIFGSEDCYFDRSYAEKMQSYLRYSELKIIDNTGHMPHEEQYEKVDEELVNFFDKPEDNKS